MLLGPGECAESRLSVFSINTASAEVQQALNNLRSKSMLQTQAGWPLTNPKRRQPAKKTIRTLQNIVLTFGAASLVGTTNANIRIDHPGGVAKNRNNLNSLKLVIPKNSEYSCSPYEGLVALSLAQEWRKCLIAEKHFLKDWNYSSMTTGQLTLVHEWAVDYLGKFIDTGEAILKVNTSFYQKEALKAISTQLIATSLSYYVFKNYIESNIHQATFDRTHNYSKNILLEILLEVDIAIRNTVNQEEESAFSHALNYLWRRLCSMKDSFAYENLTTLEIKKLKVSSLNVLSILLRAITVLSAQNLEKNVEVTDPECLFSRASSQATANYTFSSRTTSRVLEVVWPSDLFYKSPSPLLGYTVPLVPALWIQSLGGKCRGKDNKSKIILKLNSEGLNFTSAIKIANAIEL
jgi:hypothetical protein